MLLVLVLVVVLVLVLVLVLVVFLFVVVVVAVGGGGGDGDGACLYFLQTQVRVINPQSWVDRWHASDELQLDKASAASSSSSAPSRPADVRTVLASSFFDTTLGEVL